MSVILFVLGIVLILARVNAWFIVPVWCIVLSFALGLLSSDK